ncbi:hypothetical protein RMN62_12390 [Providencia stuartii]|nr:hypothetical protein [Providencia stuartii]
MQSPPDLLTPLSEIIGYSESELQSQSKWLRGCRITSKNNVFSINAIECTGKFLLKRKIVVGI